MGSRASKDGAASVALFMWGSLVYVGDASTLGRTRGKVATRGKGGAAVWRQTGDLLRAI